MLTATELRELRRVHIRAGRVVDALFAGDYRSAVRGRGMEFEEVRAYVPGDDVRYIDWKVTARANAPYVKVFREERQLTVLLAVDVSGSTRVGSGGRDGGTDRRLQMARVAGGLAWAGARNRDQVGLLTFTDRAESWLPPRKTRGHVWAMLQEVYAPHAGGRGTDLSEALHFLGKVQRRRAVVVLVSDFLDGGPWERVLGPMIRRHTVHAVVVHDPLDEGLAALGGLVEVVDAETGRARLVDARTWRGRAPVAARVERLRRLGARTLALSTEEDPFVALQRHFHAQGARR
ncbi:MAG: DUF58 domain-containing protein [Deltaproteobacteria bacterium]|nr:DUF58 domain-containing protein [Deltaproteobacteria bacterium]